MNGNSELASKILSYLTRIRNEYKNSKHLLEANILNAARIFMRESTEYAWDNEIPYDIVLFLPMKVLEKIPIADQKSLCDILCKDLNACASGIEKEYITKVIIEENNENDSKYQKAFSLPQRFPMELDEPDALTIREPSMISLFISHRNEHKKKANCLARALEEYGISSFVAHDTIKPMKDWYDEILKTLETMEIMIAMVTDNFHESEWTNQEIGYALGRGVPIIPLKIEKKAPKGLIGYIQACKVNLDQSNIDKEAKEIFKFIREKMDPRRLKSVLINKFIEANSFNDAKKQFSPLARFRH